MIELIESIKTAKCYVVPNASFAGHDLDAVVASTGPKREMDLDRADYAVSFVKRSNGNLEDYKGLWIAAGVLNSDSQGNRYYGGSQREGIVNRWIEHGVSPSKIIQIGGEDTVDKVRQLGNIPKIKNGEVKYLGIASYPLHIARFNLALSYAQEEGFIPERMDIVGIEMPYDPMLFELKPKFRVGDWITGIAGLARDAARLERYGFNGSTPNQSSDFHKALKSLNSEDRGKK